MSASPVAPAPATMPSQHAQHVPPVEKVDAVQAEPPVRTSPTHMTALPPGFITVRIMQFLATTVILALSAFQVAVYEWYANDAVLGTAVITWIILVWMIVATYMAPKAYNYWAVLAMEIFLFLAWISGLFFTAILVDDVAEGSLDNCTTKYNPYTGRYVTTCYTLSAALNAYPLITYISCAMAGVLTILFLVSMIVISVFIARHRSSGGHNIIGSAFTQPTWASVDSRLQEQNLSLQQQVLTLQQRQFEMEKRLGIMRAAPVAIPQGQTPVSSIVGSPEMSQRDVEAQYRQHGEDVIQQAPRVAYA